MNVTGSTNHTLTWPRAILFVVAAVTCFHTAYWPLNFAPLHFAIFGYLICLTQLARLATTRQSFYTGLLTSLLCIAPQLVFFWHIFGPAAIPLWLVLALWTAAFTGMAHVSLRRLGTVPTALIVPFIWVGIEYFRSELYYLKFAWMNVGYALSGQTFPFHIFGIYGAGFIAAICAALFLTMRPCFAVIATATLTLITVLLSLRAVPPSPASTVHIAGVQMEFPAEAEIRPALDAVIKQFTNADIVVLSEYTLDGQVPDSLRKWCRTHQRYLVIGGKDPAPNNNFYNTAFVIGPDGETVFRQGKSVPIQFFKDGLPALSQNVWDSPWGKIGFCVCYDLSYTRVVDGLVANGAQLLIVPTMDLVDWGERQHQLHALVAPVRSAEYGVPIFRLASSGISQAVDARGHVLSTAPFNGEGKILFASLTPAQKGSLPLDRWLAPLSVVITGILVVIFSFGKRKTSAPVLPV